MSSRSSGTPEARASVAHELGRELGTWTVLFHTAVADRLGLNITDHKALGLLLRDGPMTAGQIAELLGLTTGAVTGVIDRLEEAGYVRRARDANDRRKVVIEPVEDPEQYRDLGAIFAPLDAAMTELAGRYSAAELETIADFLARGRRILEEETRRLRQEAAAARRPRRSKEP
jgi:DNA-binding MarR family transcriptional regulator